MKVADIIEKLEKINKRQQDVDKEYAVYMEHINGMLEKILLQSTTANGQTAKNVLAIGENKVWAEQNFEKVNALIEKRLSPLEHWRSKIGGIVLASFITGSIVSTLATLLLGYIFRQQTP